MNTCLFSIDTLYCYNCYRALNSPMGMPDCSIKVFHCSIREHQFLIQFIRTEKEEGHLS